MKLRLLVLALFSALALRAADATPLFNATLTVGKEHRFVLVTPDSSKTSGWLRLGDKFEGYLIKSYDSKAGTLVLEKDGKPVTVALVGEAAVINAPASPTPATLADATALMNKIRIDDLLERTVAQQRKAMAGQINNIGTNFPGADPAAVDDLKKRILAQFDSVLDPAQLKTDLTKIYSDLFSKEELNQISSFYDTPLGQMLLTKQPEVQEKLQATIMPRMAQLGPKVQQMAREFAMEQMANRSGGAAPAVPTTPAAPPTPKP